MVPDTCFHFVSRLWSAPCLSVAVVVHLLVSGDAEDPADVVAAEVDSVAEEDGAVVVGAEAVSTGTMPDHRIKSSNSATTCTRLRSSSS